jgi:hypothetical protein
MAMNLAECSGHSAGNRRLRVESAFGSVQETKAALHIARCDADSAKVAEAYELADRVAQMCWQMLRPQ